MNLTEIATTCLHMKKQKHVLLQNVLTCLLQEGKLTLQLYEIVFAALAKNPTVEGPVVQQLVPLVQGCLSGIAEADVSSKMAAGGLISSTFHGRHTQFSHSVLILHHSFLHNCHP